MSPSTLLSRSESVRSAARSTSTSESVFQKISKRASFPHKALSRTRSLLHRTSKEPLNQSKRTSCTENEPLAIARSNSTAMRGSWHGLFEFERNGTQQLAPELLASTSYDHWPKLRSLDVLRRESADSGYGSGGSRRSSQASCSNMSPRAEKDERLHSPVSTQADAIRSWSSSRSKPNSSSTQSFLHLDQAQEQAFTKAAVPLLQSTLDEAIHIPLPVDDALEDCPDLETSSICSSDLSCSVDKVLESEWPDLGIVTEEMFLARKKEIANILNAPATPPEREAWWTCDFQSHAFMAGQRWAEFRRSLYAASLSPDCDSMWD